MKKTGFLLYIVAGLAITAIAFFVLRERAISQNPGILADGGLVLYSRFDCPHCVKVKEYIDANKITEKIKITEKEIHDADNAAAFFKQAVKCGIPEAEMGVPLLTDGNKCYAGDAEIIDYLSGLKK